MERFELTAPYAPAGDQPKAIGALLNGLRAGKRNQTLLGVTGSGKTFTIANVIAQAQKPTLVIAHNKTLAAQLAQEYREFFPHNAVHYFVSYYDYYQPEAYIPHSDTYIEKEAQINEEIDRLRHASTQALLTRTDVIIVASVSCIYALGSPEEYRKVHLELALGGGGNRAELMRRLVALYFERTNADLSPGTFRALGNSIEIMPTGERIIYRVSIAEGVIEDISILDAVTRRVREQVRSIFIFPAKHYVTPEDERERALADIKQELSSRLATLEKEGKVLEAERLKRRTNYDIAMIREVGYCNGIENYSRHFDGRAPGEPPYTLLDYFPKNEKGKPDFLTVIDESHVTVPQIGGMYAGDRSRKETLVAHGFRLPSAVDNRPLTFDEFTARIGSCIFTSATPGAYEREVSDTVVEQIIRPTGLVDPEVAVRGVASSGAYQGQVHDFLSEAERVIARGGRVLVTTLTKKMAEDLAEYLRERKLTSEYLHSDVKTIDRIEILTAFRKGEFDCLVGVNLLREGLDLPEVELVAILDADKEGFLRSEVSLIQTIGRAARNVLGRVVLYADVKTASVTRAVEETERRRALQSAYNAQHGITPQTVRKAIRDITDQLKSEHDKTVASMLAVDLASGENKRSVIARKRREMAEAVKTLDFETAALLRDELALLEGRPVHKRKRGKR